LLVQQIGAIKAPSQKSDFHPPGQIGRGGLFILGNDMITKTTELRLLARRHTRTAIATMLGLLTSEKTPSAVRLAAAIALCDRGWGRPTAMLASEDGGPVVFRITEIVNDIVDPTPLGDLPVISEPRPTPQLEAADARSDAGKAEREDD
jgi:hypothetical protein